MAKHEERRFTATFQCFQSKFHEIGAEPLSLAIWAHCKRCQHCSVNAIAALLFHPDPREDDVSKQSCLILPKPLSENAPIVAKCIEKYRCSFGIVIPEGLSNQCSSGRIARRRSFAKSYIHWASLSLSRPLVHRERVGSGSFASLLTAHGMVGLRLTAAIWPTLSGTGISGACSPMQCLAGPARAYVAGTQRYVQRNVAVVRT
jgi:hypothetical protein